MRDSDVRSAVLEELAAAHADDARTVIVEEMGIWNGSVRVDIAVINGEMHGFELKSARDTLGRLGQQSELYNMVFDRVTLVMAESHVEKALPLIECWWGVIVATMTASGKCRISEERPAMANPSVDPLQLARLLWNDERRALLAKHDLLKGFKSKPSEHLSRRLAESLPLSTLAHEVRETLKRRPGWLRQSISHQ